MTTPRAVQSRFTQHALSLGLAALVTAGVLNAMLGLAGADHAAHLDQQAQQAQQARQAQRQQAVPQAIARVLVAPQS